MPPIVGQLTMEPVGLNRAFRRVHFPAEPNTEIVAHARDCQLR